MDEPTAEPQKYHKTRIAPTPSGFLHVGNALSFIITATLAEHHGIPISLRIDDIDQARVRPEYIHDIFDTLGFLEISWQEGPRHADDFLNHYSQLHRMPLYEQALLQLRESGKLFACDCSRTRIAKSGGEGYDGHCLHRNLPFDAPETCWRLNIAEGFPVTMLSPDGIVHTHLPADQNHFIVRKKDGFPAYQLTSVIDDLHFDVDFIVRGADLWSSTCAQLVLADAMGNYRFGQNTFYHHELLHDASGTKLSKSAGATSIRHMRREGWSKEAVFAHIGKQAGLNLPFNDWRELGEALLNQQAR